MAFIAGTRAAGHAVVDQEVELGLRSLAVPVINSRGQTVAALNTGVAAVQQNADEIVQLYLPALVKVQDGLRRVLN